MKRNHSGAIFPPSLGQYPSRNAFVVSILFSGRNSLVRTFFFMTPKRRDFHEISSFLQTRRGASRKLLGCFWSDSACSECRRGFFSEPKFWFENFEKFEIFDDEQRVFHLRIRVSRQRGFYLREKLTQVVRRDNVFWRRLYESSRAVTLVDGLPPVTSHSEMTRRAFFCLIVLIIYNTATGSFDSKKCPPFLEL